MINEQAKVPDNQTPKLLSTDVAEKIDGLKREVSYLVNKIKYFRPKTTKKPIVTPKPTAESNDKTKTDESAKPTETENKEERSAFDKEEIDDKQFAQDIFNKFDAENKDKKDDSTTESVTEPTPSPEL